MLSDKMQSALNDQINMEFASAHIYLGMAAYFESIDLPGAASWMRIQFQEEEVHAFKIFDYVHERDGDVALDAIEAPAVSYDSPLAAFEAALEHERKVTAMINKLYEIALAEKDYASQVLLHWYIDEQVEEESNASQILDTLKMIGDRGQALVMLDRSLGQRGAD